MIAKIDPELMRWIQRGLALAVWFVARKFMDGADAETVKSMALLALGNSFLGVGQLDAKKVDSFLRAMDAYARANPSSRPPSNPPDPVTDPGFTRARR